VGISSKLVRLLRKNLSAVREPKEYAAFRKRLIQIQPSRRAPKIKESPENALRVGISVTEQED
jgi:hypothetical protein